MQTSLLCFVGLGGLSSSEQRGHGRGHGHLPRVSLESTASQCTAMEFVVDIVLAHAGERSVLSLCALLRCGRVSRRWQEAVLKSLPTLPALDFRGYEARITGPDVLAVLARVAGKNLAAVDLARCRRLGAADMEQILACVAATCPRVAAIDVTGSSLGKFWSLRGVTRPVRHSAGPESPRQTIPRQTGTTGRRRGVERGDGRPRVPAVPASRGRQVGVLRADSLRARE